MKKKFLTIFTIITLSVCLSLTILLAGCDKAIPKGEKFEYNPNEWDIVFEDNFDGESLDLTKWRVRDKVNRAAYTVNDSENVFLKDGNLVLRTNWRTSNRGTGWHTAWIETATDESHSHADALSNDYKGFSAKYGYFEIRCQAPPAKGIWSAFWLMPDEGVAFRDDDIQFSGADGVEIDIMESPMYAQGKSSVAHVIHGDGYSEEKLKSVNSGYYHVPYMYSKMHTYALEWTKEKYIFYIDGYKTWETSYEWTDSSGNSYVMGTSDVLQFLILSVEVGGHSKKDGTLVPGFNSDGTDWWNGNPDKNNKSKNYDFKVDYVKVMQRK